MRGSVLLGSDALTLERGDTTTTYAPAASRAPSSQAPVTISTPNPIRIAELRRIGTAVQAAVSSVPGLVDLSVEQQTDIPTVSVRFDRSALARYGLEAGSAAGCPKPHASQRTTATVAPLPGETDTSNNTAARAVTVYNYYTYTTNAALVGNGTGLLAACTPGGGTSSAPQATGGGSVDLF